MTVHQTGRDVAGEEQIVVFEETAQRQERDQRPNGARGGQPVQARGDLPSVDPGRDLLDRWSSILHVEDDSSAMAGGGAFSATLESGISREIHGNGYLERSVKIFDEIVSGDDWHSAMRLGSRANRAGFRQQWKRHLEWRLFLASGSDRS